MIKKINWFFKNKKEQLDIPVVRSIDIPKGWYVAEAGQNPLHMLWFVVLVNFDDVANHIENPRHFVEEECDSFEQALQRCIKKCK